MSGIVLKLMTIDKNRVWSVMLESGECCTEGIKFCYQELITEMHFLFRITVFRKKGVENKLSSHFIDSLLQDNPK